MVAGVCKNFSRNAVRPGCFVVIGKLHSALNFIEGKKLLKVWYDGELRCKFGKG